jgi:hypothetical protein
MDGQMDSWTVVFTGMWIGEHTKVVWVPGLTLDKWLGQQGCLQRWAWLGGHLTFLRTCCSLAEWAFTCLRRELGSV